MPLIHPTEHCKSEWSRMAADAYATDRNSIGHKFSAAASLRKNEGMYVSKYDALMTEYREWLNHGWPQALRMADSDRLVIVHINADGTFSI